MLLEVFGSLPETSVSSRESYFSKVDRIRRELVCGIQLVSPLSCGWPLWGLGNTLFRWITTSAVKIQQLTRAWFYFYYCLIFVTVFSWQNMIVVRRAGLISAHPMCLPKQDIRVFSPISSLGHQVHWKQWDETSFVFYALVLPNLIKKLRYKNFCVGG